MTVGKISVKTDEIKNKKTKKFHKKNKKRVLTKTQTGMDRGFVNFGKKYNM